LLLSGQLSYGQQNYFTIEGKLAKKTDYDKFQNNCISNVEATLKTGNFKTGGWYPTNPFGKYEAIRENNNGYNIGNIKS